MLPCLGMEDDDQSLRKVRLGFLQHDEVENAATKLALSPFGTWAKGMLEQASDKSPPLIGLSLLHAGQVIPAAAISMIARDLWPGSVVAWGGPHVSGIGQAIDADLQRRNFAADLFVTGHAEQTFVEILDHVSSGLIVPSRTARCVPGIRGSTVAPLLADLGLYDDPPVLPAQSTLGCAYGRCSFCTYPAIEPTPTKLDLCLSVESVVDQAIRCQGTVAIKDSLVTPRRLKDIAMTIGGRVKWSACTKLNAKLDFETLRMLEENGLATLEVGLESLLVDTQLRVAKLHPENLFEEFLRNVAKVPGLSLVINYITDFPWEDPSVSSSALEEARDLLHMHLGARGMLEHNSFELERLSPMAKNPEMFGINKESLQFYPWASVVEYEAENQ